MEKEGTSLLDHLEALRSVLLWVLGAVALLSIPGIIFAPDLLQMYIKTVLPPDMALHYFTPFEPLIIQLELGMLAGAVGALPLSLLKLGQFISPGLYEHERRWGIFFVLSSLLLMLTGIFIALFFIVPIVMKFSGTFAVDTLQPVIGLGSFLRLSALLGAGFALVFEMPVALLMAIRMGLVRVATLQRTRPFIITGIFVLAAILTPPDVVSQLMMGIPAWLLFEITMLIGKKMEPAEDTETEEESGASAAEGSSSGAEEYTDDAPYRQAARRKRRIRHL